MVCGENSTGTWQVSNVLPHMDTHGMNQTAMEMHQIPTDMVMTRGSDEEVTFCGPGISLGEIQSAVLTTLPRT